MHASLSIGLRDCKMWSTTGPGFHRDGRRPRTHHSPLPARHPQEYDHRLVAGPSGPSVHVFIERRTSWLDRPVDRHSASRAGEQTMSTEDALNREQVFVRPDSAGRSATLWMLAGIGALGIAVVGFVLAIRGQTGQMALQVMTTLPTLAGIGALAAGWTLLRSPQRVSVGPDGLTIETRQGTRRAPLGRGGLRHRRDRRHQPSPPPQYHRPEWPVDRQARRIVQPVRCDDQPDRQPRRGPGRRHGRAGPPQEAAAAGGDRRRDRPVHGVRLRIHRLDDASEAAGRPAAGRARSAGRGRDRPPIRRTQWRDEAPRVPRPRSRRPGSDGERRGRA